MIRKKNRFLTFIFSFIPGAGEMYMGFFKQGASIMLVAFGIIAVTGMLEMGPLIAILPVLWCYSFFHVHALASAPDEEFYSLEDRYIFNFKDDDVNGLLHSSKAQKIFAVILIIIGVSSIWQMIENILSSVIPGYWESGIRYVFSSVPQLVIGLLIIAAGVYLIKGKKQELDQQETVNPLYVEKSYIEEKSEEEGSHE